MGMIMRILGDGIMVLIYKALAFSRYKRFAKPKKN